MPEPAVPLYPYQQRWLLDKSRFKIGMFSRQSGKTFTTTLEIVDDCFAAAAERAGKRQRWVILSRGERQAAEAMEEGVKRHAAAYGLAMEHLDHEWVAESGTRYKALEVGLPGGSRITALPANPETARGYSANVFLDEFARHQKSREIWGSLFPVISAGWRIRVTSTEDCLMAKHVLYDHMGRPVDTGALREEHSGPSVTGIRSILTTHPAGRLTPQRLANILRESEVPGDGSSEDYVELAEEMEERDLHYLGVLNTRKRQVARIGVAIEPASDGAEDLRDAELVQGFFDREVVTDELVDVLDAIGKGYSVAEIDWETSERDWMPKRLVHRLPQWFDFDRDTGEHLLLRQDDGWEPLAPYKYVTHVTKVKSGIPIRGGLARAAAWAWLFKTFTLKDWMRFVEAYGHPMRLGRFPPNADPDDKAVLYRAVRNVAADAAAIIPEGMNIEFVDDTTVRGRAEVFREFVAYLDSRLSIAVLGQTLTTEQGDRGSQALGNVHQMVREDIEESDAQQLAGVLRRDFVIPVVALNHGMREAYPRVVIQRKKSADAKLLGDVLEKLVPMGLRVRADQVRSVLHLDAPADDDEVLEPAASTSPVMAAALRRRDQLATAAAQERRPAIEQVVDAIEADEWQTLAAPVIEPVLARAAANPEGLLRDLTTVYPDLDVDALTERLARVLFVADAWGRLTGDA